MLSRLTLALLLVASPASAQATRTPSYCHALADATQGMAYIQPAALRDVPEETVDIH